MIDMLITGVSKALPKLVRVSLGTAIALGLFDGKLDAPPTTAYLMTYWRGKCSANCGFCPQARESRSRLDMLSRVSWPIFSTNQAIDKFQARFRKDTIKRVCIQALNYPMVFTHVEVLVMAIKGRTDLPISVSCQPLIAENIKRVADAGAERIGIPLDAATESLFERIKGARAGGPYSWRRQFELLKNAVSIFGRGRVSTHLIVGLGETERETISVIQKCKDMGVSPALFAFTPILGTRLERERQPTTERYRRVQVARSLILNGEATTAKMRFSKKGQLTDFGTGKDTIKRVVQSGQPFLTTGCPNCNRPYYNEKPSGPIYNFPRELTERELSEIEGQLGLNGA
jgi:biotin synthase-related radical SAM superfamily protein